MTKEEVLKIVTHTGDCYRVKSKHHAEPFNIYVTQIGQGGLMQEAGDLLKFQYVNFYEIEWIEHY